MQNIFLFGSAKLHSERPSTTRPSGFTFADQTVFLYLSNLFILAQLFLVAESSAERTNANLSGNTLAKERVWPDFGEVDYASETGQLTLQDC